MAVWSKLPRELEIMIFQHVVDDRQRRPEHHVLAKCASVCRAWQDDFEIWTFSQLCLSQTCLPRFRSIVRGEKQYRLEFIQVLWFRIRLDEYDCGVCQTAEDARTIKKNCITFTNSIWRLLKILSAGDNLRGQRNLGEYDGLELEISVHSPSDNKHVFRPLSLNDYCPYADWHNLMPEDTDIARLLDESSHIHDPPHGWTNGAHVIPNPSGSTAGHPTGRDRLLGTMPLGFDFSRVWPRLGPPSSKDRELPQVSIITCLTVCRSNFRGFSPRVLFKLIHESCVNIRTLRLEKWLELYSDHQAEYKQEFQLLLKQHGLPQSLKEFYLVEESSVSLHPCISWSGHKTSLGFQLARSTRGLEYLSISWATDAVAFFQEYFEDRWIGASPNSAAKKPWSNLLTLTLTCSEFRQDSASGRKKQRNLLQAACVAARLMPQLRTLQIWNCGGGSGALFEFRMREDEGRPPLIKWMTTWPTQFTEQDKTFECWRTLGRERDIEGREPHVDAFTTTHRSPEELQSKWGLRHSVDSGLLHFKSSRQIRWEEMVK